MSGGDWGLVGLGGSKYGPQKSDFLKKKKKKKKKNWWNVTTSFV